MPKNRLISLLIIYLLTSCVPQPTETPLDINALYTQMVGTLSVSIQQTRDSARATLATPTYFTPTPAPTNTWTPSPIPTNTTVPTWTYAPVYVPPTATFTLITGTPATPIGTSTVNPNVLAAGCSNLAFIRDETIPAGTELKPKENFIKTWKVANNGTCAWLYQYRLAFLSGQDFDPFLKAISRVVEVNDWTELSLQMDAPKNPGVYKAYFRLTDLDGKMFGATLEVSIVVKE